jgi:hypothetical protein
LLFTGQIWRAWNSLDRIIRRQDWRQDKAKMDHGTDSVYIDPMSLRSHTASTNRINAGFVIGLMLFLGSSAAFSQDGPPRMPQFEADAPKVGEALPDIMVHDDLGNLVNVRDLAGENYKVLVLGCLT